MTSDKNDGKKAAKKTGEKVGEAVKESREYLKDKGEQAVRAVKDSDVADKAKDAIRKSRQWLTGWSYTPEAATERSSGSGDASSRK